MQPDLLQLPIGVTVATYAAGNAAGLPVLFVHGNSLSAATFFPLLALPELQHLRLVALDLPGHGASPDAPEHYHPVQLRAVLVAAARALGLERAMLVGHSYGGHLALDALPDLPQLGGLLTVGAPPVSSPADIGAAFAFDEPAMLFYAPTLDEAQVQTLVGLCLSPAAAPEARATVAAALRRADGRARTALAGAIGAGELQDEVGNVRRTAVPLAFAAGEAERLLHFAYFEQLVVPTRRGAPLQLVPQTGHTPFLDNPAAFAQLLLAFCAAVRPVAAG